jgi:exodeoxyribonuclease V alpha subunit
MSTTEMLFPTGTLRRRFGLAPAEGQASNLTIDELLGAIALVASQEQFDPALVWTARRLVFNEAGLSDDERRLAILVVLVLLIASSEGSTLVPLLEPNYLDRVLERLELRLVKTADELRFEENPAAEVIAAAARDIAGQRTRRPEQVLTSDRLKTLVGRIEPHEIPFRPIVVDSTGRYYSSERLARKERALATALRDLATAEVPAVEPGRFEKAMAELEASPPMYPVPGGWRKQETNDEQRSAIELASTRPLTLVTGGPGTGKTTIVVGILRTLIRLGVSPERVALAAPTGKAANRMRESIDKQLESLEFESRTMLDADRALREGIGDARTLHRLLGYSPRLDLFRKGKKDPLDVDVVICDESSMIDLDLMHALVEALPDGARLILVGDANQLPSVAGGAVFRDLVEAFHACTARLSKSFRMDESDPAGSSIYRLSQKILASSSGNTAELVVSLERPIDVSRVSDRAQASSLDGVSRLNRTTSLEEFTRAWFERFLAASESEAERAPLELVPAEDTSGLEFCATSIERINGWFRRYGEARILCVTRVFKTGAESLNKALHRLYLERHGHGGKPAFVHGEPVIFLQNNYELGLFNGDQGVVASVRTSGDGGPGGVQVVFPRSDGGYRRVPLSQIRHQIEHAFAMSVHKSQGSEFKYVAVVCPEEPLPMVTKELLYTAVTRASKGVVIFDGGDVFADGAARPVERFTGLVGCLRIQETPQPSSSPFGRARRGEGVRDSP